MRKPKNYNLLLVTYYSENICC